MRKNKQRTGVKFVLGFLFLLTNLLDGSGQVYSLEFSWLLSNFSLQLLQVHLEKCKTFTIAHITGWPTNIGQKHIINRMFHLLLVWFIIFFQVNKTNKIVLAEKGVNCFFFCKLTIMYKKRINTNLKKIPLWSLKGWLNDTATLVIAQYSTKKTCFRAVI